MIGEFPYIVHNDWLYTIVITNFNNSIRMVIEVKPIRIDEVFWTVFEMKEEADKKPFSFHVNAAFADIDEKIAVYCEQIRTSVLF